jgi:hypothetical protein
MVQEDGIQRGGVLLEEAAHVVDAVEDRGHEAHPANGWGADQLRSQYNYFFTCRPTTPPVKYYVVQIRKLKFGQWIEYG